MTFEPATPLNAALTDRDARERRAPELRPFDQLELGFEDLRQET